VVDSISPSRMHHALRWLCVVSGAATLLVLPISSFADCTSVGAYIWSLGKPGAIEEHVVALDTNGRLYVEGAFYIEKVIDTWLTSNAMTGTTIWKVTNSGGTKVAAVYQNNSSKKFDMVIAGKLKDPDSFGSYSGVSAHWKVDYSGTPLLALKRAGDATLPDGSLILKCTVVAKPIGFVQEQWVASGLVQPVAFTFIPGMGRAMFVSERASAKIRYIKDDATLLGTAAMDLSSRVAVPPQAQQHGLMGVACHPKFADPTPRRYVYAYGTSKIPTPFPNDPYRPNVQAWPGRIYRWEVNAQLTPIATPAPIPNDLYIYTGNTTPTPASPPHFESVSHSGGCLRSYTDGTRSFLLLSTGCVDHELDDGHMSGRPQDARSLVGKLLRWEIEDDGDLVIPSDNPLVDWVATPTPPGPPIPTPTLRYPREEVIASGFRNPYTFALRPGPTPGVPIEAWVSNVGGIEDRGFEEINRMRLSFTAGGNPDEYMNFGFPRVEGNSAEPTPWATPGYQMYTGCDISCAPTNNGGDLSDVGSLPYVAFSDLEPPAIFYLRFEDTQHRKRASVGGGAFISTDSFPSSFFGDFLFLDWWHGSICRIPASTIDAGTPYRIESLDELKWWDTGQMLRNYDMLEGPDGYLYYTWYDTDLDPAVGGIDRLRYIK